MVVIGLFIRDNNTRGHFYLMGLSSSSYRGRVEQRKKPQPTFCVSAKLWLHSHIQTYTGSCLLDPEDVNTLRTGDADLCF